MGGIIVGTWLFPWAWMVEQASEGEKQLEIDLREG
jgi:hypothetical protein